VKGEGDWNRAKLRLLFSDDADDALNAIDRETVFYRKKNKIAAGSDTAMTNRFGQFLDEMEQPRNIPVETTMTGAAGRGLQAITRALIGSNATQNAERFAGDLGRISVAQGSNRDVLLQAIRDYAQRRARGQPVSDATARLAHLLLMGNAASSP
jgi:hypothetical protein